MGEDGDVLQQCACNYTRMYSSLTKEGSWTVNFISQTKQSQTHWSYFCIYSLSSAAS